MVNSTSGRTMTWAVPASTVGARPRMTAAAVIGKECPTWPSGRINTSQPSSWMSRLHSLSVLGPLPLGLLVRLGVAILEEVVADTKPVARVQADRMGDPDEDAVERLDLLDAQ